MSRKTGLISKLLVVGAGARIPLQPVNLRKCDGRSENQTQLCVHICPRAVSPRRAAGQSPKD